jgi:eukaryotic-like serine/threonine-protein kinase
VTNPVELLSSALEERYAIERELGQGGMATVYLGQDLKHGRKVAIKVLRPELSVSLGADRFLREIRVAATLQHPNILGLYDSGEANGLLYYVMPFVEGESIRDRLNREQQLPIHDALQMTREAAEALAYAHERGIVHRDIKPENILLQQGHALVADFGIARAVSQAGGEKLTQTGMAVGTPHYMSPEQSLGSDHVDARSDVYSLGCVLYELLVGQPPFLGPNAMAIMARHSMEQVPSMQVVRQSVPDEVEDAVMQALEKTPADRFQTMRQFAEVLSEAEADAALQRTAARRAAASARRTAGTKGVPAVRRTGARAVAETERRTPVEVVAARIREGGVKFWSITIAALAGLTVMSWSGWRLLHRPGAAAEESSSLDARRIAVLYFEGQPGADSLSYLADGLTDALIHELTRVPQLQVISSNGVRPYKKGDIPLHTIAQTLRVGSLVHGSLAESGNRLRVTVSLINASNSVEVGSKTLERPREEIFALQDDLAKEVSIFLRQQLGEEITLKEIRQGTTNRKAWELLEQAEEVSKEFDPLLESGDTAAAGRRLVQADSMLARVEALDPNWTRPSVMRGWLAYRETDLADPSERDYYAKWLSQGLVHADRALKLKPDDGDALELRGTMRYWQWLLSLYSDQDSAAKLVAGAEQDLRGATANGRSAALAWTWLSHLLLGQSRTGEAKLAALKAYEADPYLSTVRTTLWRLFQTSLDLEDKVEAERWCAEGQRRFPDSYRFVECQLWLFGLKGVKPDIPKAWQLLGEYQRLSPSSTREYAGHYGQMLVAMALARAGLKDSASRVAERARADATLDTTRELDQLEAIVRLMLGQPDEAIRMLSTYLAANPQNREAMAKDETWWLRDLRKDPRFRALLGLPTTN